MKSNRLASSIGLILACALSHSTFAATSTGTVAVSLTLVNGCIINGSTATTGLNFGNLNFGTANAASFSSLTASLTNSTNNIIGIKCSPGDTFSIEVTSSNILPTGANVHGAVNATAPRYLLGTVQTLESISYALYSDSAQQNLIVNGTPFTTTLPVDPVYGAAYSLYGQISGVTDNSAIYADTYTDTINLQVNY